MTDDNRDLAEELREKANYPDTLRITTGRANGAFDDALEQLEDDGPADEAVRSFACVADIRRLLTDRRLETMQAIMSEPPESTSALADRLERNYAEVHADVQTLAEHHIVYFETTGRAPRPVIPYERVCFDVEVTADSNADSAHV